MPRIDPASTPRRTLLLKFIWDGSWIISKVPPSIQAVT